MDSDREFSTELAERIESELYDMTVTVTATATDTLELVASDPPSCLILTHPLPELPLVDVLDTIAAEVPDCPVVLLTDDALDEVVDTVDLDRFADVRSKAHVAADPRSFLARLADVVETSRSSVEPIDHPGLTIL